MIQIAGIRDWPEARLLIDCGVNYLGFPLRLAVHREDLTEAVAAAIVAKLPSECHGVAITYLDSAATIAELVDFLGVQFIQLHGPITPVELHRLRSLRPDLKIIKGLIVGTHSVDTLYSILDTLHPLVDAFITDTYDPATGACGATGKVHDWGVSRELVKRSPKPVILAGGLNPENVAAAIKHVNPAGVDVHTGVEDASGRKDRDKVERFLAASRHHFAAQVL